MKVVRGLSGVVAAGTVVLTLVVLGTAVIGAQRDFPGPGSESMLWHIGASVIVIAAQIYSDRRTGIASICGSLVVFLVAGILLWTQWWS